ncbi:ABC transporter permease subunit [Bowdeniella nasicola]|uniref:ABC transporter permease n=1 Tax=Bowdeniella nasicola TaxID=208480 RepID=UPI0011610B30
MENTGGSVVLGVLVVILVGAACGAVNGLIVSVLRLQPLILTFATASVFSGVTLWILPAPGGRVPQGLTGMLRLAIAQVPVSVLLVIGVAAIWLVLGRTRLMRHIYATGSDEEAAFNSLVPVTRARALSYVLAGVLLDSQLLPFSRTPVPVIHLSAPPWPSTQSLPSSSAASRFGEGSGLLSVRYWVQSSYLPSRRSSSLRALVPMSAH